MATSSKFDISSSSPDRPLYTGQRGSHISVSLDRPSSFRENMENPILSSLPNMSRSGSSVGQGDVTSFLQGLRFDPKSVAAVIRQGDFKRHVNVALGISPDESPSSSSKGKLLPSPVPEEIKRVRNGLRDSSVKARARLKIFSEALSVFNTYFPSISSKKRSRSESFSSDRSGVMLSDRSVLGPSVGKVGVQSHASGFELEQQKSEERAKNVIPNKRTRTSLVDGRMDVRNSLVRPSGTVDRDKEMLRLAGSGAVQGEDRTLSIGVDGWEKSKMKKKRSGIKPDSSPSTALTKPVDVYRESKQGMQQRLVTDARSKLSNDSHAFRTGVSNGAVGVGKSDGISQQTGLGVRVSTPRNDQDNNALVAADKRDRPASSDKERVNLRAVNKGSARDDSASPTSSSKLNTSIRAPRSGSGVAPKLSPVVHRAAVPNDWELSHCTTKPPAGVGTNNRKRVASVRSSSPPVAHWAGQRQQKSSRTARRTNFMPIISSNDDSPALDTASDVAVNDLGMGFPRRLAGSSPQQIKLKGDPLSSAVLSESEESGVAEIKSKDKGRKPDEIDQKAAGQNVQKVSNLVLSSRKNKLVSGEEHGEGVRRQGRTGRGFTSTRAIMPTTEKLGNIGTAKQLRSARLGSEKNDSKAGRPPTRKLSDRKAYTRQKHTPLNAPVDFLDDGHEELLAAVNSVVNSARAFSSPFWRQMEPFFGLISEEDITYWKQKGNLESSSPTPMPVPSNIDGCETITNGFGLIGYEREIGPGVERSAGIIPEQLLPTNGDHYVIPLCQRLIAALISEEDCRSGLEDVKFDAYETEFEPNGELELNNLDHHSRANFQFACHSTYNGYRISGKPEHDETESDIVGIPTNVLNSNFGNSVNGILQDKTLMASLSCSDLEYDSLNINDKILLELQSIGISPEPVPDMSQADDEGIYEDITKLEENYRGQISKKKGLLEGLLKSASMTKELQEKDFEQRALDKLIAMAYEKYMACWRPSSSGGKSSSNKMAKQAALAFVKRTLERCYQFEDTGKSCFSEPLFKDMFLSASSCFSIVRQADGMEGESTKPYGSSLSLEARTASMGSQQSPSQFSQNMDNHDLNSSDMLPTISHSSEQTSGKEDLWSNRVKKRELSLDDVVGAIGTLSAPSGIGTSLSSNAKGKRSERDREGKEHSREALSRNGTTKVGRPALSSAKGERKSKTKPKQKATQHSVSVNGLLGKLSEQPKPVLPSVSKSNKMTSNSNAKEKDEFGLEDPIDLSHLQLPGMDVLGVPDDLDGQGQDLGSWLNIDDDGLQDHDFMGLEIPMDDLADLNMMV
ncbi:hypothetical protein L6164_013926 [Bauhinia variegata]|uniref:Uncharacterized protein n=1 Tax=Bauhinia variegata TaxID=167791 RepID=A0ACB9NFK8_BAUVA|nr:hypothetical protein L6164_013926 [Bauhinia variegata]